MNREACLALAQRITNLLERAIAGARDATNLYPYTAAEPWINSAQKIEALIVEALNVSRNLENEIANG